MKSVLLVLIGVVLFVLGNSLFIVKQGETAVVFRLGEIIDSNLEPGLHMKVPFINSVRLFDSRMQTLDAPPERYLTKEQKNLIVDSFVKWRIVDAELFFTTLNGDIRLANMRLGQIITDALRAEFGDRTVQEVISRDRDRIVQGISRATENDVRNFGIEIADIRVKRVDLPEDVSDSVYRRMEAERTRVARELRAEGTEAGERITADAERQKVVLLSQAFKESEIIRGHGDAKAARIFSDAYSKNPEFYGFFHSLESYQRVFNDKSDIMIIDANSDFFNNFNDLK